MTCHVVKTAHGHAIVCTKGGRTQLCACGRRATLLCDYRPPGETGTCDLPLCKHCAVSRKPGIDWCKDHSPP